MVQKIKDQASMQEKLDRLDTLTEENLKTQTETVNGVTTLRDRRLFVNYLKSKRVDTAKMLFSQLGTVRDFAKKSGVPLSESDTMTIIAASDVENTNWDMCGEFAATRESLDSKNEFYPIVSQLCQPIVPTEKRE